MTRREFAEIIATRMIRNGVLSEGEALINGAMKLTMEYPHSADYFRAIAEVATNGFTPEAEGQRVGFYIRTPTYYNPKQKPVRPFIGSHKLPYDSDWD